MKKTADFRLTPRAKQVIMSFIKHKADSCKYLETDGKVLNGKWMGGRRIAYWKDDKIVAHSPDSKSKQIIMHAIENMAPKSKMASIIKEVEMNKYQKILADFLGDPEQATEENQRDEVLDLDASIVKFFQENESPDKQQIHDFATSLNMDPEIIEGAIYNMLSAFINKTEAQPNIDTDVENIDTDGDGCMGCSENGEKDGCPDCAEHESKYTKILADFLGNEKEMKKADKKWTLSEVKNALEDAGSHFFSRKTLKFFGQSMRDFGVANVAGRIFIYSKRPNNTGIITFHEFLPSESRTRPLGKGFKHIDDVKDYLRGLKKGGGKEEQGCSESDGCGDSKYAKVLDSFLKEAATLPNYLSKKWEAMKDGKRVVVSDNDLDKLSDYFRDQDTKEADFFFNHSVSILNPKRVGTKDKYIAYISRSASVKKTNKHAKVLDSFLKEEKTAITTEHFKVHIKWPKEFGEYGKSEVTNSKMDEYVNKLIGKTVESIKYPGLSLEIGAVIPGRVKNGTPILNVNIYWHRKPGSNLPKDWSNKLINKLKEIKNIIRIK